MIKRRYLIVILLAILFIKCDSKIALGFNENASINKLGDLPENPFEFNAINTSLHPQNQTITILYGNQLAYNYARLTGDKSYPTKSILYCVTWQSQADEQWFGANISGKILKIERIEILENSKTKYEQFNSQGKKIRISDGFVKRIHAIKLMRMAVSP